MLENVLAVPLADESTDAVHFYDISDDPHIPRLLDSLDLDRKGNAHAVALVDLGATTLAAVVTGTGTMNFFTLNSESRWSGAPKCSASSCLVRRLEAGTQRLDKHFTSGILG